jgi:hypothetical protein
MIISIHESMHPKFSQTVLIIGELSSSWADCFCLEALGNLLRTMIIQKKVIRKRLGSRLEISKWRRKCRTGIKSFNKLNDKARQSLRREKDSALSIRLRSSWNRYGCDAGNSACRELIGDPLINSSGWSIDQSPGPGHDCSAIGRIFRSSPFDFHGVNDYRDAKCQLPNQVEELATKWRFTQGDILNPYMAYLCSAFDSRSDSEVYSDSP